LRRGEPPGQRACPLRDREDAEYRQLRKAIIRTVVRQPKLMEPIIRSMQKARNYFKKLASPYNI